MSQIIVVEAPKIIIPEIIVEAPEIILPETSEIIIATESTLQYNNSAVVNFIFSSL